MLKKLKYFLLICIFAILNNCTNVNGSIQSKAYDDDIPIESNQEEVSDYTIQLGDVLDVKFYRYPELNEKVKVRPDGKISLQLVGETMAAGYPPALLVENLKDKFKKWFKEIDIVVIVQEFSGNKVYVGGEVIRPGVVQSFGNISALESIFLSGGFKETAYPGNVIIIRKGNNNKRVIHKLNLKTFMSGESVEENILLRPYDVVYVPKSFIAKANKFVEQYIVKMIPGQLHAGFNYVISDIVNPSGSNITITPP